MSKNEVSYLAGAEQAIPLERLRPFANHPFQVRHDLEMRELMDSIGESGIITPILVRPKENGLYEVISGHRRWEACKELGVQQIPAKVLYLDDDEATVLMVNSNIQREHVLPSEKAFAYKMRMEAMKHQGRATLGQVVPKSPSQGRTKGRRCVAVPWFYLCERRRNAGAVHLSSGQNSFHRYPGL